MKRSDTLIYGISLGLAFFLTGINLLVEFIPRIMRIVIAFLFIFLGVFLSIITLISYVGHKNKIESNKNCKKENDLHWSIYLLVISGGILISVIFTTNIILAIANITLAILTWRYLEEIQRERRERHLKEHTEDLKKKVIQPLIKALEEIPNARRGIDPLDYNNLKDQLAKVEEEILFEDLKNHAKDEYDLYENFKEIAEKLSQKCEEFQKKLKKSLKNRIRMLDWEEFLHNKNLKPGFFEENHTTLFFIDVLLSGAPYKIDLKEEKYRSRNNEELCSLLFKCKYEEDSLPEAGKYESKAGEYIDKEINKKSQIKNTIENLLNEYEKKFQNEIKEIHQLIKCFNTNKELLINRLKKLRAKTLFQEKCEYV